MIINGKKLSEEIINSLQTEFKKIDNAFLAIVLVGGNKSVFSFIKQKRKVAEKLGVELKLFEFSIDVSTEEVIKKIKELSSSAKIKGIIVQLPLPDHLDSFEILNGIPKEKDVDALGINAENLPVSVKVLEFIFQRYKVDYNQKRIVIVGFGRLVGKPIYNWLSQELAQQNIFVVRKGTPIEQRNNIIKNADILISGVGKAGLISSNMVKPGKVLIDFGYAFQGGRIYGDIDKKAAVKASIFTPTPGGVGPILVAMIFKNLMELME